MWIEMVTGLHPEVELADGADPALLDEAERRLGQVLPADLRGFLTETDGLWDADSTSTVWPVEQIVTDNIKFRTFPAFADLYQPFDDLLFFGDNGGGDQFAFRWADPGSGVFVWGHEVDRRVKVADDLADYLRRCLTSEGEDWYDDLLYNRPQ